jgi:cyclopropane-fatty-acyl-phospholipid synthase
MIYPKPFLAKVVFSLFKKIEHGQINLTTPEGEEIVFGKIQKEGDLKATFKLNSWSVIANAINHADIGFGEDYIEGKWETDNLPNLLTIIVKNGEILEKFLYGNIFGKIFFKAYNLFVPNSIKGSKKNIKAHYDVGNDFYKLWLDKTLTYSSGIFNGNENKNLEDAQKDKYTRILSLLNGKPKEKILEIGSGWGGFALEAAKSGYNINTITLSEKQFEIAKQKLKNHKNASIEIKDYRHVEGEFDYIVSIEMFEAVGERFWNTYFAKINQSLKKDGKAVIQTIIIRDDLFERYRKTGDFIRRYTFPGGMLPSMQKLQEVTQKNNLKIVGTFSFGKDYAITLQKWFNNFTEKLDEIKKMGYSDEFIKSWQFYLSACIAVFKEHRSDVVQLEIIHNN